MSAIYFTSRDAGTVKVLGQERWHFISVLRGIGNLMLVGEGLEPQPAHELLSRPGLNRVLRLHSQPLMLMARIHAQCESHCWVDGPHRAWLAAIIEQGRGCSLFRPMMGWEDVMQMLLQDQREPVFLSYSVSGTWPPYAEDLSIPEQYDRGEAELRAQSAAEDRSEALEVLGEPDPAPAAMSLELRPSNWFDYRFAE